MNGGEPQDTDRADGHFDPARRAVFAQQELLRVLATHCSGSRAELRSPAACGDDRSRPASAPADAVAATKAVLRGQPQTAQGLLERGSRRIGAPDTVTGSWPDDIGRLAEAAAAREPGLQPLADRVVRLARRADTRARGAMMDGCDLNRSPGKGWPRRLPRTPKG
ncbi:hypothetical protein LRD69_06420 [Streptomyces sp. JH14]|uniref:hypothetical protein n=1 Tax=Streptomyces sp. JH14 TaxID=2793630 RepID=UPI0023F719D1|nr:hypothetical protein [Streptomyces sp. JH14]MDF6041801.1 hypothetical protein [Streptomyces sp. JH14]